jgi:hypothetical protein
LDNTKFCNGLPPRGIDITRQIAPYGHSANSLESKAGPKRAMMDEGTEEGPKKEGDKDRIVDRNS